MVQSEKKSKEYMRRGILVLLIVVFCFISMVSLSAIVHLQGNARVINYAGIVRGATQRLVKQELNGSPNDELIRYLDEIVAELSTGEGEHELILLPDSGFQGQIQDMQLTWEELKKEIYQIRKNNDREHLYALSETYFEMADEAVTAAELYSETQVSKAKGILFCLNGGFIVLVILFWIYGRQQKKVQLALDMEKNANIAKSEFLSRMSHEIRTPMNGIIGMTTIARDSVDDRDKLIDCLDKIDLSSNYLMALINDILDMSRIESGKIELEKEVFELPSALENIYEMFKQKAKDRGVDLQFTNKDLTVKTVVGDALRLTQVLVNILSNALKFTPEGGQVKLEVYQKSDSDEQVSLEFVITDTGVGISEDFQAHIFEPFKQEQAATARQYGGTGLGLTISYNFIQMMGGDITVNSTLGKGTQFTVSLTLERPSQEMLETEGVTGKRIRSLEKEGPRPLAGRKVLLAEDNEINAQIVIAFLEKIGLQTEQAHDGEEAVHKFELSDEGEYFLILMDVQMPVMDGLKASRTIRALDRCDAKTIRIIGLSANAFREDIEKALDSGMNGYLSKPINMDKLLETIEEAGDV